MAAYNTSLEFALEMDRIDPLKAYQDRFYKQEGQIYMDGNSLGMCSKDAEKKVLEVLGVWKNQGIGIWNAEGGKYFLYPSYLGKRIGKLINARETCVTTTNSTSVNIHQVLTTLYKPTAQKYKILVDELNFPTDKYAVDSHVRARGMNPEETVKVIPAVEGRYLSEEQIIEEMTDDVAFILLPSVLYRSAQLLDMERLTKESHQRGIIIGFDLCHSIGAIPHDFERIQPDYAIWCNYKYLSGGPGTVAGIYVNERHFDKDPGMAGWHGNKKSTQFQLNLDFEPAPDVDRWLTGTPPILSMAAIDGVLDIFEEIGMEAIREKSLKLTDYLMYLIDTELSAYGFAIGNPREDKLRGGHVSLEHAAAYQICQMMKKEGIIPDFREPNVIRLAPVALYTSYEEVYEMVQIIKRIYEAGEYRTVSAERSLVV